MNKQFGKTIISALLVSFLVLGFSTTNVIASKSSKHESDKAKINRAMKAAPISISAHATILDADGTILREGSPDSEWVCFPGVPLIDGDKHPMCNDAVWMDWLARVTDGSIFEDEWTPDTVGYSYMLRGDALIFNNHPDPGHGDPDMLDQEGPHLMILYPTGANLDHLPKDPNAGGPYVMWYGTPVVHVMVPLTDRDR